MVNRDGSFLKTWGRWLCGTCIVLLIIGNASVHIFFPELVGKGLNTTTLTILIAIWSIGVIGIVMMLIAWISEPATDAFLDVKRTNLTEQPSGRIFSRFTKFLAALTALLMLLGLLAGLGEVLKADSPLVLALILYPFACVAVWVFYLSAFYTVSTHRATTTFQNHFTPFLAPFLVPLVWPLLIVFNIQSIIHDRQTVKALLAADSDDADE